MYNFEDEPNWTSMRRALTAGNPDAIIAFSPGVKPFICTQGGSDFTVTMPVYLDSEKIYEGQKRVAWRRGGSLIRGTT